MQNGGVVILYILLNKLSNSRETVELNIYAKIKHTIIRLFHLSMQVFKYV